MLDLVVLTLYLKVEPLAHSFFNLHHYTAVAFCVAVGLRAIHLLLRVKIKMAEMESC